MCKMCKICLLNKKPETFIVTMATFFYFFSAEGNAFSARESDSPGSGKAFLRILDSESEMDFNGITALTSLLMGVVKEHMTWY